VIGEFIGLNPLARRLETTEYFSVSKYSLGVGLGIVSCGSVASNEPT
jgi:hypothetical protein